MNNIKNEHMYKNIVTVDPSLTSTGIIVNGKVISFAQNTIAWNKKQTKLTKWFNICESHADLNFFEPISKTGYSETEVNKLQSYREIAERIAEKIKENLVDGDTIVGIEGYSYSSASGPLIDLVTFSTHLRSVLDIMSDKLIILSPSTLKLEASKLTYEGVNVGKRVEKWEWRNNDGMSGGSFKKHEMYKALTENSNINDDWNMLLREYEPEILNTKSVPKPIEDINDAKLMYEIIKCKINNNDISLDFIK